MTELDRLNQEYDELLNAQQFDAVPHDHGILNDHLNLLEIIDRVDNGCISIFDLSQRKHLYYSPKFGPLLGWDPLVAKTDLNYTNTRIHPDDLILLFRAGIFYLELGLTLEPPGKKKEFKAIFEYRVKGKEDKYLRVIEQQIALELDSKGQVWLALSMIDLCPDQSLNTPFRAWLKNVRTNELFNFPDQRQEKDTALTHREKEILQLIASGLISKEIADKLYISVNTVNTHRQRIIEKLNVSNTYEAIRYANDRGLFA